MIKNYTLILLLAFFVSNSFCQAVTSTNENSESSNYKTLFRETIKNNTIACKLNTSTNTSALYVYNSSGQLINTNPLDFIPAGSVLAQVNTLNSKDSFHVIMQYYTKLSCISVAATFNSLAQLTEPVYVLDSVPLKDAANNGQSAFVASENGQYFGLINIALGAQDNRVYFNCRLFSRGEFQQLTFSIPKANAAEYYSNPAIDNNMNIFFAGWLNAQAKKGNTNITFYKINTNLNQVSQVSKTVKGKAFYQLNVAVNNEGTQYILAGTAYNINSFVKVSDHTIPLPAKGIANSSLYISACDSSLNTLKDSLYGLKELVGNLSRVKSGGMILQNSFTYNRELNKYEIGFAKIHPVPSQVQNDDLPFSYGSLNQSHPYYWFNEGNASGLPLNNPAGYSSIGLFNLEPSRSNYYTTVTENSNDKSLSGSNTNPVDFVLYLNSNYKIQSL
ncbi:MAG: hypothetical protein ABIY62_02010 [Ginsengibacter sp.]